MRAMLRTLLLFSMTVFLVSAQAPVYVLVWFDTEDYIEPSSDDAAMRIANDLTRLGVRATFKIVGEKARVMEARKRYDVLRALSLHDIGYHAETHSGQPTPALYMRDFGLLEGADEFERREGQGVRDLERIFGVKPSCYGQPGNSWGPQSNIALRRMGIPVYLDEGGQVGLNNQPFWYGGLLYMFNLGKFTIRASLDKEEELPKTFKQFDEAANDLQKRGGGVISVYYHPNEFVTTEFWDGVNFSKGANPEKRDWKFPKKRTSESSDRAYRILTTFVEHMKKNTAVRFITARELIQIYKEPAPAAPVRGSIAKHIAAKQTFMETYSAADMLLALLGLPIQYVDGPTTREQTTYKQNTIPRAPFERTVADVVSFIRTHRRLPPAAYIGSTKLALGDFAATLAGDDRSSSEVTVRAANLEFENYIGKDPQRLYNWVIHPEGFSAPQLLELGRLQAWTLKPAVLR